MISSRGLGALWIRAVSVVFVLLGVAIISFALMHLIPGDVVDGLLGQNQLNPQTAIALRRTLGLDRPVLQQFADWFTALLRGDLGVSLRTGRPVATELLERVPATFELAFAGLALSIVIGLPLGVLSATRRNGRLDLGSRLVALLGISLPNFWLGIFLILIFSVFLRALPSGGYVPATDSIVDNLRFLAMPAVTLGFVNAAVIMRVTRSTLLDVLGADYVRTARAKGLAESTVIRRHALRSALIPVVTVIGIQMGSLLGGIVVVEQLFSWPGLGTLVVNAIVGRDYPVVQGVTMLLAVLFVFSSLAADIAIAYLDPRIRRG